MNKQLTILVATILTFLMLPPVLLPIKPVYVASAAVSSGARVTVFSDMVFQNTGTTPVSKAIVHPDGTQSSVFHVKGQSHGDSAQILLQVTIANAQHGTHQIVNTMVSNSFDISIDVWQSGNAGIIGERDINTISIVLNTNQGSWNVQCWFDIGTSGTDVYIITIPSVAIWWVSDMNAVARGVAESCMVKPLVHLDTWRPLTYLEITDMPVYQNIIEHPDQFMPPGFYAQTGIIVVNAHGEVLPLPSGYTWDTWISKISSEIQTGGLTWVQVAGWPFYYYSRGAGDFNTIGPAGFQKFMEPIAGSPNNINCYPRGAGGDLLGLGTEYNRKLLGYGLVSNGLSEWRPIDIGVSQPSDQDSWTEDISCSDGFWWNWAMCSITRDTTKFTTGSASIHVYNQNLDWGCLAFSFNAGKEINMNDYPVLCYDVYLENMYYDFCTFLIDANGNYAWSSPYSPLRNKWCSIAIRRNDFDPQPGFDWSRIKTVAISLDPNHVGDTGNCWFDHMFFDSGASTVCHCLDLMAYQTGRTEYLSLGLVSFAAPNQDVSPGQRVGYYVHNGAGGSDSDYNKGKYSMATAAWIKISLLAETWFWMGFFLGTVECKLLWAGADVDVANNRWYVDFVTTTLTSIQVHPTGATHLTLTEAQSLLRVTDPASQCSFEFKPFQSTRVEGEASTTWQEVVNQVAEGAAWIVIGVIASAVVGPEFVATTVVTIALGGLQTGIAAARIAFRSPNPVLGPGLVDLGMDDNSNLDTVDQYGTAMRQLQSFAVTRVGVPMNDGAGAHRILNFETGQRVKWTAFLDDETCQNSDNMTRNFIIEPRPNMDSNSPPDPAQTPTTTTTTGRINTPYTFYTKTTDPEGDDVSYTFYWGDDPTNNDATLTGYYESGNVAAASHQWTSPGDYNVYVLAHDCQRATANSNSGFITMHIVTNQPPNTPTLSGPSLVYRNVWYQYSTNAVTDPEGDRIRYHIKVTGPGNPYEGTTDWVNSGTPLTCGLLWETTDNPGTYLIQVWVEDEPGALSGTTSKSVNMILQGNIDSYNIYLNNAGQNLTTVVKGYQYMLGVQYSWNYSRTSNVTLTAALYDSQKQLISYAAIQQSYLDPGTYTVAFSMLVPSFAYTGIGILRITLMSDWPYAPGCFNYSLPRNCDVNIASTNNPPSVPSTPTGYTTGYVYLTYGYTTSSTDPNQDSICYLFDWNDTSTYTTGWYASGVSITAYHSWTRPGTYSIYVKAKDPYSSWISSPTPKTVTITQNDDGTSGDAGNSFATATVYNASSSTGTLYASNPTDPEDWYQFYADSGKTISAWLSSTGGSNFDLELYYPNGTRRAFSNSTSSYDSIYITATVSGWWRMRLYRVSGEGLYYFGAYVYTPGGGGGGCPTLFVWNGSTYVDYGVINIHDGSGQDLIRTVLVNTTDVAISKRIADFRLTEGWVGLTFSESLVDQVKLYAIDESGDKLVCPLVSAWHSSLGNVLPQLLLSDDKRVQSLLLETIDIEFLVPHRNISAFEFIIEGFNAYKV